MNIEIITKTEKIIMPYYEISSYCRRLCKEYCQTISGQREYDVFCSKKHLYDSSFLFAIKKFGFIIKGFLLNHNRVLCYQNDHLTSKYLQLQTGEIKGVLEEYKSILKQEYKEYYPNVDDSFHALDYFCLNNCIIRPDGTTIEIPAFKDSQPFHHDDLYEMDVHYSLIENKKVCQLYHLAMEKSLGMTINQFCRIYQGYVQLITYSDGTGIVLYNKEMISDKLWEYINFIQMNIPSFMIEAEEKKLEKVM